MYPRFTQILLASLLVLSGGMAVTGFIIHNQPLVEFGKEACKYFGGPLFVALQLDRANNGSGNPPPVRPAVTQP